MNEHERQVINQYWTQIVDATEYTMAASHFRRIGLLSLGDQQEIERAPGILKDVDRAMALWNKLFKKDNAFALTVSYFNRNYNQRLAALLNSRLIELTESSQRPFLSSKVQVHNSYHHCRTSAPRSHHPPKRMQERRASGPGRLIDVCAPVDGAEMHVALTKARTREQLVLSLLSRGAVAPADALTVSNFNVLRFCSLSTLSALIRAGANVNYENASGARPLHFVVQSFIDGDKNMTFTRAKLLLQNDADASSCSSNGRSSPLCLAATRASDETREFHRRCLLKFFVRSLPQTELWTSSHDGRRDSKVTRLAHALDYESLEFLLRVHRADKLLASESSLLDDAGTVDASMRQWLRNERDVARCTPPTLTFMCRSSLRRYFGVDADERIKKGPAGVLPQHLRDWLLLRS